MPATPTVVQALSNRAIRAYMSAAADRGAIGRHLTMGAGAETPARTSEET
jgi:hypothetical protein